MSDIIDRKHRNEQSYINKHKYQISPTRSHKTISNNSASLARSRPANTTFRKLHRQEANIIQNRHAVDFWPEYRISRKYITNCVLYKPSKNKCPQIKFEPQQKLRSVENSNARVTKSRIVALTKINTNLFLGNREAVTDQVLKQYNIATILNVGTVNKLNKLKCDNVRIHTLSYPDTRSIDYASFIDIIQQCVCFIRNNIQDGVLVVCDQGVNRSVSVVVAYGVATGLNLKEIMNYVDFVKYSYDSTWNNLTNFRIRRLVSQLTKEIISA